MKIFAANCDNILPEKEDLKFVSRLGDLILVEKEKCCGDWNCFMRKD